MNLDPQQKAAVETQSRRALVVAGAGSGKTRVLTERIAHLIEHEHVSPYEILCWTFTRKAASEMRARLVDRIGVQAHRITMGTMHAVALQMLRRFGELAGYKPANLTVYGAWEEEFLLKEVAREIGFLKKSWKVPKKDVDRAFSDYYERGIEPGADDPCRLLFTHFLTRCGENNALTYGGLLIALKRLIPAITTYLRIRHILVDEVQDIDPLQWSIINDMCSAFSATLFVVGDVDQSCYSFRGAVPEYLVAHQREFDVFHLETNYRSYTEIVEASNRLIRHNAQRIYKTMRAARGDKGSVEIWPDCDSAKLAEISIFTNPEAVKNTAILARVHALLKKLSDELTDLGVPHTYVGRKSALTNSEEFRRYHAFLKLFANPYDNFSFLLITDLMGLDATDYAMVRVRAVTFQYGMSHFQAWKKAVHRDAWEEFFRDTDRDPPAILLRLEELLGDQFPLYYEAQRFAMEWFAANPGSTVKDYLDWLATYDLQDELSDQQDEGLVLSTIHGAKGLEWPTVIVAGCNEGILPSKQAIAADEIEEERRLMYVAMTRAMDHLVIAVRPECTEKEGRVYKSPASRFVVELEKEGVEWRQQQMTHTSAGETA